MRVCFFFVLGKERGKKERREGGKKGERADILDKTKVEMEVIG